MPTAIDQSAVETAIQGRADELFHDYRRRLFVRTDRMFAVLLGFQWLAGIVAALVLSPRAWAGADSHVHPHVWAAVLLAGVIDSLPIALALLRPGETITRHAIAVGQMCTSAILIHLSGGRIETHFHVFGSLAFLAVYRDWRVLVTASTVVAADHFLRGLYWPQSVYGVLTPGWWRWLEHAGWVVFEDVVLIRSCVQGTRDLREIAASTAQLEANNQQVERKIVERTAELHASQQALQCAKDAAEAGSRAKSEFLANMSHEIRTPMNGIIGMTELVLDTALTRMQREQLQTVRSCAEALLALMNDVLDFSKIEAGKLRLDSVPFNLHEVLDDTVKALGLRAHEKGLELACHVGRDVPDELLGDPGRLRQIVMNLLGNAVKFTHRGEVILRVTVDSQSDRGSALHFVVLDTGKGVPLAKQQAIFQAFEQADLSTSREYGGTGLGLAIVARLVSMMQGEVWLESEVGKGSAFHFTACFGAADKPDQATTLDPLDWQGAAVLVVDDNQTNRQILHDMLEGWGLRPTLAASGGEALTALDRAAQRGCPFRLVLLDGRMPGLDGLETAERIKASPHAAVAVALLSSTGHPADADRCRQLGLGACLTKPVRRRELFDCLCQVLGQTAAVDEPAASITLAGGAETAPHAAPLRPLLILVAEDNVVNQRVAKGVLDKHGHTVILASNGREAVDAVATQRFDLVLMDVQMPEMDGLAATRMIREMEAITGGHTPIVAMTAFAMKGDEQRCLDSGMDAYLSKPIRPAQLLEAIGRLVGAGQPADEGQKDAAAAKTSQQRVAQSAASRRVAVAEGLAGRIDLAALLVQVEDDWELLAELVELFLESSPRLLEAAEAGLARGDWHSVERTAHALKGAMQNIAAVSAAQAAAELEEIGRAGDSTRAAESLARLQKKFDELVETLEQHTWGGCL